MRNDELKRISDRAEAFESAVDVMLRIGEIVLLVSVFVVVSRKTDSIVVDLAAWAMFFLAAAYLVMKLGALLGWLLALIMPPTEALRRKIPLIALAGAVIIMPLAWVVTNGFAIAIEAIVSTETAD